MLVRGKPVDQVALRDHILVLQRQGAELAEANPLADRVTVVAGKLHDGGHVDHVRVGGELAFIVAPRLLRIVGEGRLNADLVGLHVLVSVFVPAGWHDVPAGVDLPVDHKVDNVAFLDGVAAGFLPGANMGDQIELQQIVRRTLADVADLAQLFLVHDLRVSSLVFRMRKVISSFAENDLPEPGTPSRNADWFRRFALLHMMRLWEMAFSPK